MLVVTSNFQDIYSARMEFKEVTDDVDAQEGKTFTKITDKNERKQIYFAKELLDEFDAFVYYDDYVASFPKDNKQNHFFLDIKNPEIRYV